MRRFGSVQISETPPMTSPTWGPPGKVVGALSGTLSALAFTAVHGWFIVDIWDGIRRMLFAGVLCGVCIVWSYRKGVGVHSTRRWLAYNGMSVAILIALGAASFLILDPQFTMAELEGSDDALARLIPPALPLLVGTSVVGALGLWVLFGRRPRAFLPILVAQILLVFLVGHNLAILGLVESSSQLTEIVWEFIGLTAFLGAGFAFGVMLIESLKTKRQSMV